MAAQMDDEIARQAMLAVADNYVVVAKRAETRAAGVDLPNFPKTGQQPPVSRRSPSGRPTALSSTILTKPGLACARP
jgi:hypothetical protein